MDNEETRLLAKLEGRTEANEREIDAARRRLHDVSASISALQASFHAFEQHFTNVHDEFLAHMDREEKAFEKLYDRLGEMDSALVESFKERDHQIARIDKATVRIVAYTAGAIGAGAVFIEILVRLGVL